MEKSIKGTRTEQNLLKSFAGESQARSRYTFFASVAKKEGYEQIAGVFMETAEQEKEHAKRFFKFLEGGDLEITASYPRLNTKNGIASCCLTSKQVRCLKKPKLFYGSVVIAVSLSNQRKLRRNVRHANILRLTSNR